MGDRTSNSSAESNKKEVFPSSFSDEVGYASTFNQDISGWDVSKVNEMNSMFRNALEFNQGIAASAFNRDIAEWSESQVTDMSAMFRNAYAFNQDIADSEFSSSFSDRVVLEFLREVDPARCRQFQELLAQEKQVVSEFGKMKEDHEKQLAELKEEDQRQWKKLESIEENVQKVENEVRSLKQTCSNNS